MKNKKHVVIIGGGFTALAAAYELDKHDIKTTILEKDESIGGLAGGFEIDGVTIEKFYHHWFTSDKHVLQLINELGANKNIITRQSKTGMYYAKNLFKLSSPIDLLRFTPISLFERIRLGLLTYRVRLTKNWMSLENISAEDWLIKLGGRNVYRIVWEPLLRGKFGEYASKISAVWIWNKLKLRGSSRGKRGSEQLLYFKGGFLALANLITEKLEKNGHKVLTNNEVDQLEIKDGRVRSILTIYGEKIFSDAVISTTALPIIAKLLKPHTPSEYYSSLNRINYIGNLCLVLELNRSLSELYWINVNDLNFPFVGIIEHTNFEPPKTYGGKHIVYLSKYLPTSDSLYKKTDKEILEFSIPYIQQMFPEFNKDWIVGFHLWKADYAQPIVEQKYSELIPSHTTPIDNLYISSMAQIYPEDRGTNYAIREGRKIAHIISKNIS